MNGADMSCCPNAFCRNASFSGRKGNTYLNEPSTVGGGVGVWACAWEWDNLYFFFERSNSAMAMWPPLHLFAEIMGARS